MAKHKSQTKNLSKSEKKAFKKLPKGVRDLVASGHGSKWSQKLLQNRNDSKSHTDAKQSKSASQSTHQNLRAVLTKNSQRILVIGDGNFSFSAALIDLLNGDGSNLVATCYDSEEILHRKYGDAKDNIEKINDSGGLVLFDIDGTRLSEYSSLDPPYDCIVFNFPHVGLGIKDQEKNVEANQALISSFLASAANLIHATGA